VVGEHGDEPEDRDEPLVLTYGDQDDFTEDLTDEAAAEAAEAGPEPAPERGRKPGRVVQSRGRPLVAIAVGAALIGLLGAAFAYEQTSRFIEARAVDDAQVIGYLSGSSVAVDTEQAGNVTINGDFYLATSAAMPLTLERIDLGYGPVAVDQGVVLRGKGLTKVHLKVRTACGPPSSAPAADVVSPDGRRYRLPVSGPSETVSDFASRFWCDGANATDSFGSGADSSYVDPGSAAAVGLRVAQMSARGRSVVVVFEAGPDAPATTVSVLPKNSPRDPRARTSWTVDVDPSQAFELQPGGRARVVIGLRYANCRRGDPTPALDPVRLLAVPVDSPDSPRTTIEGWREDVVTEAAKNALDVDCTG
jgi:hypothetical protein